MFDKLQKDNIWHRPQKKTILKQDGGRSWILGHNVYSVVLFQLIGTILSAFVRLKKSYHYSHPCSQNASQVVYTRPLCTHLPLLTLSKYISKW